MEEKKQPVKITQGKLCRMFFCEDCSLYTPIKSDKTGETGRCEILGGYTVERWREACEYFEH